MKIENWSCKQSHKLNGITVGRIISSDSVYDSIAYDPVKTGLSESGAEVEEPTSHKVQNGTLSLVYSSASAGDSNNAVFT